MDPLLLPERAGMVISSRDGWIRKPAVPMKHGRKVVSNVDRQAAKAAATSREARMRKHYGYLPAQPDPHVITLRGDVDYSVSGLGAYRQYRSHPGRSFPNLGLTVSLGDHDKDTVTSIKVPATSL